MFTVRPGMYIKKLHVDFKSTELWKKHLSDKIVLWCESDGKRRRGRCEGCDFLSVSSTHRHFSIHSNQDESGMFARGLRTCASTRTHTHTHYKSTEISIMLISVRGNRFQNIPSNYVCDSFISEGESCLCVCVYMQWQKEKWRVSVKKCEEPERGVL